MNFFACKRAALCAIVLWMCVLGFGAAVSLYHAPPPQPLVPPTGWVASGAFVSGTRPSASDLDPMIAASPGAVFHQSWVPQGGALPGFVASPWFAPRRRFQVPLIGFPVAPDIDAYVECRDSGAHRALASGNSRENWIMRLVELPDRWCDSQVRVAVSTESTRDYVGIGTPYSAGTIDSLRQSGPVHAWRHLLAFAPLAAVYLSLYVLAQACSVGRRYRCAAAITGTATLGYAAFLLVSIGASMAGGVLLVITVIAASVSWRTRRIIPSAGALRATLACYLLSLACTLFIAAADIGAAQWNANEIFRPADWSTDHLLPGLVAEGVYRGKPLDAVLGGGWQVADRPPLQAGLLLLERPFWSAGVSASATPSVIPELYVTGGIVLQCSAVVIAFVFMRRLFRRASQPGDIAFAALTVLVSPFCLYNIAYPWPKLLSGGLALLATGVVLSIPGRITSRERWFAVSLAGALFGYAVLAHAGVAIGFLALPVLFRIAHGRWRLPELAAGALITAVLWLPWAEWQRQTGQIGTALTKFALAGDFDFGQRARPISDVVMERYAGLSVSQWAATRWFALLTLAGATVPQPIAFMLSRTSNALGALRLRDFVFVLPALRFLLVAFVGAVITAGRGTADPRRRSIARPALAVIVAGVAGLLANTMLLWSVHIQHTQSYLSLLLLYAGAAGALLMLPRSLMRVIAILQFAYVSVIWVADSMSGRTPHLVTLVLAALALVALLRIAPRPASFRSFAARPAPGSHT